MAEPFKGGKLDERKAKASSQLNCPLMAPMGGLRDGLLSASAFRSLAPAMSLFRSNEAKKSRDMDELTDVGYKTLIGF